MSKKKSHKKRKVANLATQNAQKSINRKSRNKQKRQLNPQSGQNSQQKPQNTQKSPEVAEKLLPKAQESSQKPQQITPEAENQIDLLKIGQQSEIELPLQNPAKSNEQLSQNDQQSEALQSEHQTQPAKSTSINSGLEESSTPVIIATEMITEGEIVAKNQLAEIEHGPGQSETEIPAQKEKQSQSGQLEAEYKPNHLETEHLARQEQKLEKQNQHKRHKFFPLIWWILGIIAVAALAVGGYWLIRQFSSPNLEVSEEGSQNSEDPKQEGSEGEQNPEQPNNPEEDPAAEAPAEPADPPKEAPSDSKLATGGNSELDPIAPRPPHDDLPEVTPGSRLIALTFDDGPSPANTPRLLDILNERNAKATFFVLGNLAERNPAILQRQVAEGHEVASHTPYHDQLTSLTAEQVRWQALEMDRIFTNTLGTVPPFTRPPYGSTNTTVQNALGQPLIIWSVDPRDWQDRNSATVCNRVVSAAFDGAIVLMHDIHATTVDAVPCIIDNLRARGYEFLTISDLAAARDVPLINGHIYYSF